MQIIPVIDLMGGQVVRGVAGRRDAYRPIKSQIAADARPATIAAAFAEQFEFATAYVADLDAIERQSPDVAAWRAIEGAGLRLWIDAGLATVERWLAFHAELPTARWIVGLESLATNEDLAALVGVMTAGPPIFSLDLKGRRLNTRIEDWRDASPEVVAAWAADAGIRELIVLDLADVGVGGGTSTLALCEEIKRRRPELSLIAGGGVRGVADLDRLEAAGCDGALVASALHDGRLTPADARRFRPN